MTHSSKTQFVMLFLCVIVAFAQGKPKIAFYIASDKLKLEEKNILVRKFLSPFTASGMYSVIDRSDIFNQKATLERIKQHDGSVNEKEIYKIGYEAGAKYVCMVELDYALGRWNIGARMVDVETAEIYLAQGETDIKGMLEDADFSGAAKVVFDQIHGKNSGGGSSSNVPQTQQSSKDENGTFTDSRDGKTYKIVTIGRKKWMAENLNYQPQSGNSWCYDNNNSNCDKYGRLYDWKTAMTVCPEGWYLPSRREWDNLGETVGGKKKIIHMTEKIYWYGAGKKLKKLYGWNDYKGQSGNGTNEYGFSALPSGSGSWNLKFKDASEILLGGGTSEWSFSGIGEFGQWWTDEKDKDNFKGIYLYTRLINNSEDSMIERIVYWSNGLSVRCVN